ncbi:toxin HicA [Gemmatimonadetes bacterium T265]|nr:toxin HicA [Gemmatimonadetes bacterium T265]GJG88873.1 toxin HicA [Gemmatimonadetes bacterium T265]
MGRHEKLLAQILGGRADANVGFDALRALLRHLGFEERTRGSHHVFRRAGVAALINLQRDGDKATVYPVRQVRAILVEHGLTAGEPPDPAEGE